MDLIIIETKQEKEIIEASLSQNYIIVSLDPSIDLALNSLGISVENSLSLFIKNDHESLLSMSDEMISELRSKFFIHDHSDVNKSYEIVFFAQLRFYMHYWIAMTLIINNAVKKYSPERIITAQPENISDVVNIRPVTSFVGHVAEIYCKEKSIELIKINLSSIKTNDQELSELLRSKSKSFIKRVRGFFRYIQIKDDRENRIRINKVLFELQILFYKIWTKNREIIFASSTAYNLNRAADLFSKYLRKSIIIYGSRPDLTLSFREILLGLIRRRMFFFFRVPINSPGTSTAAIEESYEELYITFKKIIKTKQDIFSVKGVNIGESLLKYINEPLRSSLIGHDVLTQNIGRIFRLKKPAVAIAQHAGGIGAAIGAQSRVQNVKGLLITHGTFVPQEEQNARLEWSEQGKLLINSNFPYIAVQTPLTKKYLDQQEDLTSKLLFTGPLIYSREISGSFSRQELKKELYGNRVKKFVFLHASTPRKWGNLSPYVYETLDEYISNIKDMIKVLDKRSDVHLALRVRTKDIGGMSLEEFKKLIGKSDCYSIYSSGSFEDYLMTSDVLISYSSTCIEEALQNRIPVILYDPFRDYQHVPSGDLSKSEKTLHSTYFSGSREHLQETFNWVINNHLTQKTQALKVNWDDQRSSISEEWIKDFLIK